PRRRRLMLGEARVCATWIGAIRSTVLSSTTRQSSTRRSIRASPTVLSLYFRPIGTCREKGRRRAVRARRKLLLRRRFRENRDPEAGALRWQRLLRGKKARPVPFSAL